MNDNNKTASPMLKSFCIFFLVFGFCVLILLTDLLFLHFSRVHNALPGPVFVQAIACTGFFLSIAALVVALLALRRHGKSRGSVLILACCTVLLLGYTVLFILSDRYASLPPETDKESSLLPNR
jgi:drug/metabolite transporter (DMT)-like permease